MKKRLQRHLPNAERLRGHRSLRFLGDSLDEPRLWQLNRHTVPGAVFIGVFVCLLPMPFHMVLAALLATWLRYNLPLSISLVWLNTPFTYLPVFYFNYRVGLWLMGGGHPKIPAHIDLTWLFHQLLPLWLGSLICATLAAGCSALLIRSGWRLSIRYRWHHRHKRR